MSEQLAFEPMLRVEAEQRLAFYAGYCFGWRHAWEPLRGWVQACVVTPRYIERAVSEVDERIPLIIDNGAFSAWHNDYDLTLIDQVTELERAIYCAGPERVQFVIWPDVVGNPRRTWRRINDSFRCFNHRLAKPMFPVQEGMDPLEQAQMAAYRNAAVFIGGATRAWKIDTTRIIRERFPDLHIHVGRLSASGHLHQACLAGATSFDTTSFMQQRGSNQHTDYRPRLRRYAERRGWLTHDEQQRVSYYT